MVDEVLTDILLYKEYVCKNYFEFKKYKLKLHLVFYSTVQPVVFLQLIAIFGENNTPSFNTPLHSINTLLDSHSTIAACSWE